MLIVAIHNRETQSWPCSNNFTLEAQGGRGDLNFRLSFADPGLDHEIQSRFTKASHLWVSPTGVINNNKAIFWYFFEYVFFLDAKCYISHTFLVFHIFVVILSVMQPNSKAKLLLRILVHKVKLTGNLRFYIEDYVKSALH